jgi:hypothetical protein
MTRTRKVVLTIIGILFVAVAGFCGISAWQDWQYKQYGGYGAAGIDPISGAELISFEDEYSGFLPDYDTIWVYKIPSSYTDKLYKDCSAMHYKTGTLIGIEYEGPERLDPKKPGCHIFRKRHRGWVWIQFSGDELTVHDSFG